MTKARTTTDKRMILTIFILENPICKQGYHIGNGTLAKDHGNGILLSYLPADRSYCCHARGVEKTEYEQ